MHNLSMCYAFTATIGKCNFEDLFLWCVDAQQSNKIPFLLDKEVYSIEWFWINGTSVTTRNTFAFSEPTGLSEIAILSISINHSSMIRLAVVPKYYQHKWLKNGDHWLCQICNEQKCIRNLWVLANILSRFLHTVRIQKRLCTQNTRLWSMVCLLLT